MKQSIIIISTIIWGVLLSGCEKSLNLNPKDQNSDATFWQTPEEFQTSANNFYLSLQTAPEYIDRNSDIAFGGSPNTISNGSYLAPANDANNWDTPYQYIRSTNYLLEKARASNLGSAINQSVGEAHFFRAYNYWKLVDHYGGVPITLNVLDVNSPELYTAKSTQEEVVNQIILDLDSAYTLLPKQSELSSDQMGRATQGAVLDLKARVSLFQGTWEKYRSSNNWQHYMDLAINASNALVQSNEYTLYNEKGADSYKYLFILEGDDSKEVILARRYYALRATHNWTRELWFNSMIPTKNLADMYLSKDGLPITQSPLFQGYQTQISEFTNRDPRMALSFVVPGSSVFFEGGVWRLTNPSFTGTNATRTGYMIRKFLGESLDATKFLCAYDFKEFRYGETLLILAEALYEKNGTISDADLDRTINKLRDRVYMPHLSNAFVAVNHLNMLNEIRRERTVELAFEGYRRDDLRRWKMAETVLPQSILGIKFVGTEYQAKNPNLIVGTDIIVNAAGFIVADPASARKFINPKDYLAPLPTQQVQLSNGTLVQNEGW